MGIHEYRGEYSREADFTSKTAQALFWQTHYLRPTLRPKRIRVDASVALAPTLRHAFLFSSSRPNDTLGAIGTMYLTISSRGIITGQETVQRIFFDHWEMSGQLQSHRQPATLDLTTEITVQPDASAVQVVLTAAVSAHVTGFVGALSGFVGINFRGLDTRNVWPMNPWPAGPIQVQGFTVMEWAAS